MPTTFTTDLPEPSELLLDPVSDLTLTWATNDNSPDGGIDVERSTDGFATVTTIASGLSPSTTTHTDTPPDNTDYEYRVVRYTDHVTATSEDADYHQRTAVGDGTPGAATVSRTATLTRSPTASGAGAAIATRSGDATRTASASGQGDAIARRTATITRSLTAVGRRGDGAVSRTTAMTRASIATGAGAGSAAWAAPTAWALPETPSGDAYVLVTPSGITTTHDQLSLTATLPEATHDRLSHYHRAGDVDRQTTAFGAFRRVRRDGQDLLAVRAPTAFSPPFADQRVAPIGFDSEQRSPTRHEVTIDLGLEEPRSREPLVPSGQTLTVDTAELDLDAGETTTETLTWAPDGSQLGEWIATVTAASSDASDSELVAVADAPWTFAWGVGSLSLLPTQVGQITRSPQQGVETLEVPLRLDGPQAAVLFAVGSRVPAATIRSVPDAPNTVVDTLPEDELSVSVTSPPRAAIEGDYVLWAWEIERSSAGRRPYRATIELAEQ